MAKEVCGVDIGTRSTVFLRGKSKGNTFVVTNFWAESSQGNSIEEAWRGARPNFRVGPACVGLSGREVNMRYTQVPRLPDWQLRKLMRFEVEEIGGQASAEMASDFNVLPELPEIEGEDVVLLAMARESMLAQQDEGLSAVGGKLAHFTPNAVALYNAWLHYGVVLDDTVLVANIGHENIDVVIVRGTDLLFARNLSGGSRLFDDALVDRFDVSLDRAEKIKLEIGSLTEEALRAGGTREKAAQALQSAGGQLVSLLQSAVLFCKTQIKLSGLSVDRVMLCGGGAALEGLDRYLSQAMKVPVETFDPFRVVDTSALSGEALDLLDEFQMESVIALGLAASATHAEAYGIEILPARIQKSRTFWQKTVLVIAASVLCMAYLGVRAAQERSALENTEAEVSQLQARYNRARRADQDARDLIAENEELRTLVSELWLTAGSGEQMVRAIEVLENKLPPDFWLVELSSRFASDKALGIERGDDRPVLHIEGRVREGTMAPSALFESFLAELRDALPGLRVLPSLSPAGDRFTIDLCQFIEAAEVIPTPEG
ncbi:MAG: Tfp pilus assembly PilM family ATPase [Planctomycetota bacterium]|jgi:Tfp pilus assembly PilM family ATPase